MNAQTAVLEAATIRQQCPNWFTTAAHADFNVVAFSSLVALEANQDIARFVATLPKWRSASSTPAARSSAGYYPSRPACDPRAQDHSFLRRLLPTLLGAGPNSCSSAGGKAGWLAGAPFIPLPCIE